MTIPFIRSLYMAIIAMRYGSLDIRSVTAPHKQLFGSLYYSSPKQTGGSSAASSVKFQKIPGRPASAIPLLYVESCEKEPAVVVFSDAAY
jgi:hypothetical protein